MTCTGVVVALALTVLLSTFAVQPLGAQGTPGGVAPEILERLRLLFEPSIRGTLQQFRAVWPEGASGIDDLDYRWSPRSPRRVYFRGEFRILNWNAGALGENDDSDSTIANVIVKHLDYYNANVLTLQELSEGVYIALVRRLHDRGLEWTCHAHLFGDKDMRVTCAKGHLTNFRASLLSQWDPPILYDSDGILFKNREWWGYTQVDYMGVTITNVHNWSARDRQHANELHEQVPSGIVAGDFNRERPDVFADEVVRWHQTDLAFQPTLVQGGIATRKIDHVLTVEPHTDAAAEVVGPLGSSHMMLLTRFKLLLGPIRLAAVNRR